jgi:hypothetical protein
LERKSYSVVAVLFIYQMLFPWLSLNAQGFGEFASAVFLMNCSSNVYYNTTGGSPHCINPDCSQLFNNNNFGSFNQNSQSLLLRGGEIKSWKSNNGNVCSARLNYVVYTQGNRPPSPTFSTINLPFKSNCCGSTFCDGAGPCGGNDQKWSEANNTIDLTNRPPGNYTLEVYFDYSGDDNWNSGCGTTKYISNGGFNYVANFQVMATGSNCSILLPITLTNAESRCEEDKIYFLWQTMSEQNTSHFVIEGSENLVQWFPFCNVDAAGNSSTLKSYSCVYDKIGLKYFRIAQYDLDGEVSFYGPYMNECDIENEIKIWQSLNDLNSFQVSSKENFEGTIELLELGGKVIFNRELKITNTTEKIYLNNIFSHGSYVVLLRDKKNLVVARGRIICAE